MSKSTQIQDNRERDSSIPEGHVSLESILCTEELLLSRLASCNLNRIARFLCHPPLSISRRALSGLE